MAEYGGKQRNQLSKVTGSSESKGGQLQRFVDNRPQTESQMNLIRSIQKKPNNTGLPDNLKTGIENFSGYSMDDVKVHYNSDKPAQLNALAYTQGTDIHVALGQEKHLPHEAWHVVQQMQGGVQPTVHIRGKQVDDDKRLEKEADVMASGNEQAQITQKSTENNTIQLYKSGYTPNLTNLVVPGGGLAQYSKSTFERPTGWYEGTLDELLNISMRRGRVQVTSVMGHNVTMVLCDVTDRPSSINDMDIGHIVNWSDYVALTEPANVREATSAYNDLNNLRLEAPTPNRSGDFEMTSDGHFQMNEEELELQRRLGLSLDKYDMSDPFIDDSMVDRDEDRRAFEKLGAFLQSRPKLMTKDIEEYKKRHHEY